MKSKTNKNYVAFARGKTRQALAALMAILLVFTATDYSRLKYVKAEDESKANVITSFTTLPAETASQKLAVGELESEIDLPDSLSVASEVYYIDTAHSVTGGAITVTGSAISVNPTYNLTDVTWQIDSTQSSSGTFASSAAGTYYTYVAVLPEKDSEGNTLQLADGISLPRIQVQIEEMWAFSRSQTIDGIEITVKAEKDVFPEGAVLHVEKVTSTEEKEKIQSAVSQEVQSIDTTKTVTELVSFDITFTDADGNELQPDTSKGEVRVSFAQLPMVAEEAALTQELKVFHMDDALNEAQELDAIVDHESGTLEASAEHFSTYTVALLASLPSEYTFDIAEGAITIAAGTNSNTLKVSYGAGLSTDNIPSSQAITITGTTNGTRNRVSIIDVTATLVLSDLSIRTDESWAWASPIELSGGANVTLRLSGTNTLYSSSCGAGINVPEGTSLTITSINGDGEMAGSLNATADGDAVNASAGYYYDGAGIGAEGGTGAYAEATKTVGTIVIKGGTITATGGYGGAGIGGSIKGTTGSITISGGKVTAASAEYRNGVAGIGGGFAGYVPNINITGGEVHAVGRYKGAGIGGGYGAEYCGNISISGGKIAATSGGYGAASIGYGCDSAKSGGSVTITGGNINLNGGNIDPEATNGTQTLKQYNLNLTIYDGRLTESIQNGTVTLNEKAYSVDINVAEKFVGTVSLSVLIPETITGDRSMTLIAGSYRCTATINLSGSGGEVPVTIGEKLYPVYLWFYDAGIAGDIDVAAYEIKRNDTALAEGSDGTMPYMTDGKIVKTEDATGKLTIYMTGGEKTEISVTASSLNGGKVMSVTDQTIQQSAAGTSIKMFDSICTEQITEALDLSFGSITFEQDAWFGLTVTYSTSSGERKANRQNYQNVFHIIQSNRETVTPNRIIVKNTSDFININLDGVNMQAPGYLVPAFVLNNAKVNLDLLGENKIDNTTKFASAINVDGGSEIVFDGTGSVEVTGNASNAGIGGQINSTTGKITINGGTIISRGRAGAAIGSGSDGQGAGNIYINGGTVKAYNLSDSGAAIGGGYGTIPGNVYITGGTVNAESYGKGAAIGGGNKSQNGGEVIISGGYIEAKTTTDNIPVIGSGFHASNITICPSITISGGTLKLSGAATSGVEIGCGSAYTSYADGKGLIITGGTIFTGSNGQPRIGGKAPTNGTANVYYTKVDVSGIYGSNTIVSEASITGSSYNWNNIQTDSDGVLHLYLPANTGSDQTSATFQGNGYKGTVTLAESSNELKRQISLTGAKVTLAIPEGGYRYDTTAKTPGITVTLGDSIVDATQYEVSYSNTNGGNGNHTDAGTVTVTVTGKDSCYGTASATFTIAKAAAPNIVWKDSYPGVNSYTGKALPTPTEDDLTITGVQDSHVTFSWFRDSVTEGNRLSTAPSAPGTYVVVASIAETANTNGSSTEKTVTIRLFDGTVMVLYNNNPTPAGWYNGDVVITAASFTISDSIDGTYTSSYRLTGEGSVSKRLYFKQDGTGYITDGKNIVVNIDQSLPVFSGETDGITISENHWKSLLNKITFGHFFTDTQDVTISATDSGSGVTKYYYYMDHTGSTIVKTAGELNGVTFTEASGGSFSISEENNYVIYAYAVDGVGNRSAYICTDGMVIDKTAPTVMLTAPVDTGLGDRSATAKVKMSETGTLTYVVTDSEQSGISASDILAATDKIMLSVIDDQADTTLDVSLSGLTSNTTHYIYAFGTDSAGNESSVRNVSFTTNKTQPIFAKNPTISGTYGQQVKDMTVSQVASTNGVDGSWRALNTDQPSVGTTATYEVVFTPDDTVHYAVVTVSVNPTITPKNLMATGVSIGEVTGTYTYNGTAKKPTVTVTDTNATITESDYNYSYSNNTDAGTATVTVSAKGNYSGSISRTFTIAKAPAPSITYPAASGITYGQKLSASNLSGGSTVYGTFAWTDGSAVPTVTNSGYEVTFTPNAGTVANYEVNANNTGTVTITVSKATSAVAVNTDVAGNAGSRKATLTATITGVIDGEVPTGTVKFVNTTSGKDAEIEGASSIAIKGGKATYTWTGLADQNYKVKAVYNGSDNYNIATSTELEFDTLKQNQTDLTMSSIGTKTYGDLSFTLSATGGSGTGDVTFASSDESIVSISGNTATIHKAGTVTITATKAEDDIYYEATDSVALTISKKALSPATGNMLTLSQSSYTYDGSAKEPSVTVMMDGKTLTQNEDYTVTYANNLNAGTAQVMITGQGNYTGTMDTSFTIAKANQNMLEINEVIGKKYLNSTFTLTAAGGSGTGKVTYSVPENNGVLSVSEGIATIIGTGTVTVTAVKSGDSNYNSNMANREITINKAPKPAIAYPVASSITYGQKLADSTLTGGSTEYGTFAWEDDSIVPGVTNSGYEVTFTPNTGTVANYEVITDNTGTVAITVSKATPAVTVNADVTGNTRSRKATLTATVTGVSGGEVPTGTVKFVNTTSGKDAEIEGASSIAIKGGKATYTWTGLADQIFKVKAVYNGSDNYNIANSTELEFDTSKQNQTDLTMNSIGTKTYGDLSFTLSATGGSGTGAVTFASSDETIVSISGVTATIHKAGTVTITATKSEDGSYNEATDSIALTIEKKILTVKADSKENITRGAVIPELTYVVTGLTGSDTFTAPTISTAAADTNTVGEYDITISGGTLTNAGSYIITYVSGRLTVVNSYTPPVYVSPTGTENRPTKTPDIIDGSNRQGWVAVQEKLEQRDKGDEGNTITITMNGGSIVPGEVLQDLMGQDTTLVLDLGDGATWSINGQSITDGDLHDIDLGVALNTDDIPSELINRIAGQQSFTTISLAYDGPFGFAAVLTIDLNRMNSGRYGNLFYYDPVTKQLTLKAVGMIGKDGGIDLPFDHASDYIVIVSDEPMLEKALDQIAISTEKNKLYVGGIEKKSTVITFELPQSLREAVEKDSKVLKVTYQSSNPKVATINSSGKITAKKAGETTITTRVTINRIEKTFKTVVTVKKAYLKLIKAANRLAIGDTYTYQAIGYGVKTEDIMYYTSQKSIIVINETTGEAKAKRKGEDYIIAKVGKIKVKIKVVVS